MVRNHVVPAGLALAVGALALSAMPAVADTPAVTSVSNINPNQGYSVGMAFTVPSSITVTQVGDYIVAGNANNTQGMAQNVGIYDLGSATDSSNDFNGHTNIAVGLATLLGQANVANTAVDANGFSYAPIAPITLVPGELYGSMATTQGKVWELNGTNTYASGITYFSGFAQRTTSGTLPSTIQPSVDKTTAFLDNAKGGQYVGGTFQFVPPPGPSQTAALALGALGLAGLVFAARRRART